MKKFALLFILACCQFLSATAQQENVYYIKNDGFFTNQVDSADYIRIIKPNEKGSQLYLVEESYVNGEKKSIGYSKWPREVVYDGEFKSFFQNGKLKQLKRFAQGKITDSVFSYYPNGKLYSVEAKNQKFVSPILDIITLKDSTGLELVTNGNGTAILYDDDFKNITGKGSIKNGRYEGEWIGKIIGLDTLTYKEIYADGIMVAGESTDGKGNVYHYTTSEVKPVYKGGQIAFYRQIMFQMRYPRHLASKKIQGTVQVNFTVLANGQISNAHAVGCAHPDLAAEAVKVIKTAVKWDPGVYKGRNVNVNYSMPLAFNVTR